MGLYWGYCRVILGFVFRVQRVQGLGFRVWGLKGLGFRV